VFLLRAAGRSPEELLAELRRRLDNDEDTERAEVTGQLAEITALRVRELVSSAALAGSRRGTAASPVRPARAGEADA
jgi:2-oxo-4-hydroxy-4-carboxy-5-ureidoimidazoline decarboxylase